MTQRDIRAQDIRLPLSSGSPEISLGRAFEGVVLSPTSAEFFQREMLKELKVMSDRLAIMTGEKDSPLGVAEASQGRVPQGRIPSPAVSGEVRTTEEIGGEVPSAPSPDPFQEYERYRTYFGTRKQGGFSLANLRQDVGQMAQERMGNVTWGSQLTQDAEGNWVTSEGELATQSMIQSFARREAVIMAARGGASVLASGRGLKEAGVGALATAPGGMALVRGLGIAAGVVTGVDVLAGFAERQRAENAQWQRIMGGTNIEGFGERIRQNLFALGQFGFMDPEQAEALYRGVAETGLRGPDRTRAQDFALQAYRQYGMTPEQSLQIIGVAARTGQESLMGLSVALERVTESAREAGVNTEQARQSFVRTWTAFSETIGGTAAVTAAVGATAGIAGLGPEFQGVTPQIGPQQIRMLGAQQGLTLNQYLAQLRMPGNEQMLMEDWSQFLKQQMAMTLPPEAAAAISRFAGRGAELTEAERFELSQIILMSGIDLEAAIPMLEMFGLPGATLANAPELIGQILVGGYDPAAEQIKAEAESRTRQIDVGTRIGSPQLRAAVGARGGGTSEEFRALERRVSQSDVGGFFNLTDDAIRNAFLEDVLITGRAGGISEVLATQATLRGGIGKVIVQTPEGPREVSLKEAMQKYRDQIDAGTAVIAEGHMEGASIAEAIGMGGDARLTGGQAPTQAQGTVLFGATPELRRLIEPISTSGGVFVDPASGWEPPPSQILPGDRPSGSSP